MPDDKMLREAVEAVANGDRDRARDLLTRLLKANQTNPKYWLWMSSVVETTKERVYCLQKVIRLEPNNRAAHLGLLLQGAENPLDGIQTHPGLHRDWQKSYKTVPPESRPKRIARFALYAGAFIVLLSLISIGFIGPRISNAGYFSGVQLTVTPVFETLAATATLLPTNTPRAVTPTPTFIGPTPLWMFLEETYTPTPLYVNTPHPATEAYRAGIREFTNRNYPEMIFFMQQAAQAEPDQADIQYYLGEAHLLSQKPENALFAYEKAIALNPNFAPAYLGRARALLAIDPDFDLEKDLSQAVALDPGFSEALLDLIAFYLSRGEYDLASGLLDSAETANPGSPLVFAFRSQVLMNSEDYEGAIEAAEKAYELDQTILEIYKVLGELHVYSGDPLEAIHFFEIYLRYVQEDPEIWAIYGQALFESGEQLEQAMRAFDLAIELDENSLTALLHRGYAYLELGEGQLAVNDLFMARNFDRESFRASIGLARALALSERYNDAISQFAGSEALGETVIQKAAVYYWRAQTFIEINEIHSAVQDYSALLDLNSEEIPEDWVDEAENYLVQLTPTATMTNSPIPPTETGTATSTATPQPTKITPSPTPTRTPTAPKMPPTSTFTPEPTSTTRSPWE